MILRIPFYEPKDCLTFPIKLLLPHGGKGGDDRRYVYPGSRRVLPSSQRTDVAASRTVAVCRIPTGTLFFDCTPYAAVLTSTLMCLFKNKRELSSNWPLAVPHERTVMSRRSHVYRGGRRCCPSFLSLGRICVLAPRSAQRHTSKKGEGSTQNT